MIPLDELVFLHFGVLILGLLLVKIANLSLGKFTGLYAVMAGMNIIVHELLHPGKFLAGTIISAVLGILAIVLLAGFASNRISSANYSTLLSFIGLSPWYISFELSITLIISMLLISTIYGYIQQYWAFKSLGYRWMPSFETARTKMKQEDFEIFQKRSNVVFVYPFLIAIAVTILLVAV